MGDRDDKIIKIWKNKDMENTTYELIKNRLIGQGEELKKRIKVSIGPKNKLLALLRQSQLARIITDHNCIPSDMASIDDLFIFDIT